MDRAEAISWVLTVTTGLRLSQSKTLADLVAAAMRVSRVSLPSIAGFLLGITLKAGTQRVWRFTKNHRVEVSDAMEGVVRRLLKRRKKKTLLVGFDWVEVRNFHTLSACAVMKGRGVPLLWASYPEWELHKSQNNLEEGLLRLLRTMIPPDVRVILLADRGFGRTELARLCQHLGFHYVIRIQPDVWIETKGFRGTLSRYGVKKGFCRLLRNVTYRKKHPVVQHVVVRWKRGLPKTRDECWFLMTDLDRSPQSLSEMYGKRMTIEQVFRDHKNRRNGFALRHTKITLASRFDRLLLILALAYLLLMGIGLVAERAYSPPHWSTRTKPGECSVFTIGRRMCEKLKLLAETAVSAVAQAIAKAAEKWG